MNDPRFEKLSEIIFIFQKENEYNTWLAGNCLKNSVLSVAMGCSFLTPACNINSWSSSPSSWRCDYLEQCLEGQLRMLFSEGVGALRPHRHRLGKSESHGLLFWVTVFILHSVNLANSSGLCHLVFRLSSASVELVRRKLGCLDLPNSNLFIAILSSSDQVQSSCGRLGSWEAWESASMPCHSRPGLWAYFSTRLSLFLCKPISKISLKKLIMQVSNMGPLILLLGFRMSPLCGGAKCPAWILSRCSSQCLDFRWPTFSV